MSHQSLKKNTELAMKLPDGQAVPTSVWLPPTIRDKPVRVVQDVAVSAKPPSIEENQVRINSDVDPIGLLCAIANGQPVASFRVDSEGKLEIHQETLDLKDRIKVIQYLADKIIPRMTVNLTKDVTPPAGDKESWAATVNNAAERNEK